MRMQHSRISITRAAIPWIVLAAGMLATFAAARLLNYIASEDEAARFESASNAMVNRLSLLLERQVAMLRGASGLFVGERDAAPSASVGGVVDARSFQRFIASLDLPHVYPGIKAISFSRRMAPQDLDELVEARRKEGDATFDVMPRSRLSATYPIVYVAPMSAGNDKALGFDPYADAIRRAAIDVAISTGAPAMSAPLSLRGSDDDAHHAVEFYVPVYQYVGDDQAHGSPFGCIGSALDVEEFLSDALKPLPAGLAVVIRDRDHILASSSHARPSSLHRQVDLHVAGRDWSIEAAPDPHFHRAPESGIAGWVIVAGTALSVAFCLLTRREMASRALAKRAADRVRAIEKRLRRLVEASVVGVVIGDAAGAVDEANDAFLDLVAIKRSEIAEGINWRHLTPPDLRARDEQAMSALLRGEQAISYETELVRRDGRRIPVMIAMAILEPPNQVAGFIVDLTQLKLAQRQLVESEQRFRTVADHAPVMMRTADASGKGTYFNQPWLDFTGRQLSEMLGDGWRSVIHPDDLGRLDAARSATLQQHESFSIEHRMRAADGSWRWVLDQAVPLPELAGGGIIGSCIDIDERRRIKDDALRLASELSKSNVELEQFATVASHDLQEPLRMVTKYAQLVERRYGDRLDETGKLFLGYATDGASRMRALIDDLLIYSRAGGGREVKDCEAGDIVKAALGNLRVAIEDSGALVDLEALPPVRGDQSQLVRLFQNLIGNALKYRVPGRRPEIKVSALLHDGMVEFSIRDNGIGIAPEHQERVFAAFQRLHTKEQYPGTGIGLAVCRRIVERHGGHIWVESTPDVGSTFRFTIPSSAPMANR